MRRAVLTGVAKTCRTIGEYNAASCGCDLMELSAHAGARPSHARWQGQLVSLSGKRGYLSKDDIGYGSGDGFGGYNCRHDWYPFFPGISQRNYTPEKLTQLETMTVNYNGQEIPYYDATQEQRRLERRVRDCKLRLSATDAARQETTDQSCVPSWMRILQNSPKPCGMHGTSWLTSRTAPDCCRIHPVPRCTASAVALPKRLLPPENGLTNPVRVV